MLHRISLVWGCMLIISGGHLLSQIIWDGPTMTFTKDDYADWTLAENQDRIVEDIWITRGNDRPIFNAAEQTLERSPSGTRWAFGSIADGVENLQFDEWIVTVQQAPPSMVGNDMVLYLVKEQIYIDIRFISWTSGEGNGGGGFSYQRSTGDLTEMFWTGPTIMFTKPDSADWTLAENQDRITDNVWLTRAHEQGLFNFVQEPVYDGSGFIKLAITSPADTRWAIGSIADGIENLRFDSWTLAVGINPPGMVGRNMVLHLVTDDIYIDIKFTSWTSGEGNGGGGFSYERATGDLS
ncbi:MAG: hypothetical protein R3330_19460, partial [Saprospiraceae bacterium]|nr:hypothetical protein [Saprospiraceae bacterium]